MKRRECICKCGRRNGLQKHHCVYRQELRRLASDEHPFEVLIHDPRNLVPLGPKCHAAHHNRSRVLPLHRLPDSVFEFAEQVMGAGRAYEYLKRRYAGSDMRLERLLDVEAKARNVAA